MSKQFTQIEASFTAALIVKIEASAYEFGSKIDYLSIDYNKATDDVLIGLKKDKEPDVSRVSLKEAQFISWLIPLRWDYYSFIMYLLGYAVGAYWCACWHGRAFRW